jgi:hypothetical protein
MKKAQDHLDEPPSPRRPAADSAADWQYGRAGTVAAYECATPATPDHAPTPP